jgi:chromosome segregation ATPase
MFNFLKSKSEKQIEIEARSKQRIEDEKYWMKQLDEQRARYADAIEMQKEAAEKKTKNEIKKVKDKCDEEISQWKQRVVEANQYVADAQSAWLKYKNFIPKAMDYANILKTELFTKQQEITRQLKTVNSAEDGFEGLERGLIEITPKIEKLLHFDFKGNNILTE